jgi:DNA-binding NarL/FixJ family response regulator
MKQRTLLPSPEGNLSAPIIVIEKRALIRESLALCLRKEFGCPVFSFPDIDSWQKASSGPGAQLILVSARESDHEALHALGASEIGANVMVLPDTTHLDDIVRSLELGAFAGPTNNGPRL